MNSVIDRAKQHFQPKKDELKQIHIPEWADPEDKQSAYFYAKTLTASDVMYLQKYKDSVEVAIEVIIRKLDVNDKGEKAFNRANKQEMLRGIDPAVIIRVASEITENMMSLDDAEKN